jgi:hypothetical protein
MPKYYDIRKDTFLSDSEAHWKFDGPPVQSRRRVQHPPAWLRLFWTITLLSLAMSFALALTAISYCIATGRALPVKCSNCAVKKQASHNSQFQGRRALESKSFEADRERMQQILNRKLGGAK